MDKTETYVRMADCEEVQGQHGYRQGFYVIDEKAAKVNLIRNDGNIGTGLGSLQWTGYVAGTKKSIYFYLANYPPLKYMSKGEWRGFIWLPTQDQIQEMLGNVLKDGKHSKGNIEIIWSIDKWQMTWKPDPLKWHGFQRESFEQLWLALYMYEKHNKTWDGEKWLKSDQ